MQHIQINAIIPLQNPKFITPVRINYTQNGKKKSWEAIESHNSVAVLLYHKEKDAFLLVKQLRVTNDVPLEKIERVTSYYTSVGFSGAKQTMYYAEIDESMKIHEGGGIDDEEIELFFLPLSSAKAFMFDESYKKKKNTRPYNGILLVF